MLSFANIIFNTTNISALSYQSEVGIGFTFNPTLSVSISSPDLIISNLTPGSSSDSNSINVSVATNASYGYTLSVDASSEDLVHSNNTNTFSSIATNASLQNLTTDNTWGYSTSLDNGTSWSNYNGLSSSDSATLLDPTSNVSSSVDFKIGAKAGNTQASGTYTNTITFTAVTKPTPITLAEAYASEGKTMINGFYTMQDMTSAICSKTEAIGAQLQVLDKRDHKVYWIAKLADNHCWMTQNLDLDLDSNRTYTHWDTDLGWTTLDEKVSWKPTNSTTNSDVLNWQSSNTEPYSTDPNDFYFYTSNSNADDMQYNSLRECINARHNNCAHYHAGNYYNWPATIASNDASTISNSNAPNSICPMGWRIPAQSNFSTLLVEYNIYSSGDTYVENGFDTIRLAPLYFVRSGRTNENGTPILTSNYAYYWSNTSSNISKAYGLRFNSNNIWPAFYNTHYDKAFGLSIRCITRS